MSRVGSTAGGGPISDSDGIEDDEEQDERHPGRRDTDTGRGGGGSSQFMIGKGKRDETVRNRGGRDRIKNEIERAFH